MIALALCIVGLSLLTSEDQWARITGLALMATAALVHWAGNEPDDGDYK